MGPRTVTAFQVEGIHMTGIAPFSTLKEAMLFGGVAAMLGREEKPGESQLCQL